MSPPSRPPTSPDLEGPFDEEDVSRVINTRLKVAPSKPPSVAPSKPQPAANIEAEGYLLGALLYDPKHLAALPAKLRPESFYSEAHRQIFSAICELRESRSEVSLPTVATELRAKGRLAQLEGGSAYLMELANRTPVLTPAAFESLAGTVVARATQRATQMILSRALARFADPGLNVSESLADLEREIVSVSLQAHDGGGMQHMRDALRSELKEWVARSEGRGSPGVPTGWEAYDSVTGGLHRSDLVVLGARPGAGKTSFATGAAIGIAKRGEAVGIFSLEMAARQLAGRMLCTEAGVAVSAARKGQVAHKLTELQMALSELANLGIYIDDASKGRPYVSDIVSRSRRLAAEVGRTGKRLGLIVVDYIQLVKPREELVRQRHDLAIGEVSTELKALAKELDCTVLALAQLNRSLESRTDKRPVMSDLRDSGQIEQDADQIVMLYRDEVYNANSRAKGVVEVIFVKNRHGVTGTRHMRFHGPTTRFSDDPELRALDEARNGEER